LSSFCLGYLIQFTKELAVHLIQIPVLNPSYEAELDLHLQDGNEKWQMSGQQRILIMEQ
jgi:hypothetical protein